MQWLQLLQQMYEGVGLPYLALLANKSDLEAERVVTVQEHNAAAMEHNVYRYGMTFSRNTNCSMLW